MTDPTIQKACRLLLSGAVSDKGSSPKFGRYQVRSFSGNTYVVLRQGPADQEQPTRPWCCNCKAGMKDPPVTCSHIGACMLYEETAGTRQADRWYGFQVPRLGISRDISAELPAFEIYDQGAGSHVRRLVKLCMAKEQGRPNWYGYVWVEPGQDEPKGHYHSSGQPWRNGVEAAMDALSCALFPAGSIHHEVVREHILTGVRKDVTRLLSDVGSELVRCLADAALWEGEGPRPAAVILLELVELTRSLVERQRGSALWHKWSRLEEEARASFSPPA